METTTPGELDGSMKLTLLLPNKTEKQYQQKILVAQGVPEYFIPKES